MTRASDVCSWRACIRASPTCCRRGSSFYESWLNPAGLRDGRSAWRRWPRCSAFCGRKASRTGSWSERAGEYTAEWTVAEMPACTGAHHARRRRPALRARLVHADRARTWSAAPTAAAARSCAGSKGRGRVDIRGSIFCEVRDPAAQPLCEFYASAIERLMYSVQPRRRGADRPLPCHRRRRLPDVDPRCDPRAPRDETRRRAPAARRWRSTPARAQRPAPRRAGRPRPRLPFENCRAASRASTGLAKVPPSSSRRPRRSACRVSRESAGGCSTASRARPWPRSVTPR